MDKPHPQICSLHLLCGSWSLLADPWGGSFDREKPDREVRLLYLWHICVHGEYMHNGAGKAKTATQHFHNNIKVCGGH